MRGHYSRKTEETLENQSRGYEFNFKDRLVLAVPSLFTGGFCIAVSPYTDDPKQALAAGAVFAVGGLVGILSCYDKRKPLNRIV